LALQHARLSRTELADAIGVSRQAISNLKRSPGSSLRPEHVARAARVMRCDVYWLCTGDGGDYVPEQPFSTLALELAKLLDTMAEPERDHACRVLFLASRGYWPDKPTPGQDTTHTDEHTHHAERR
jgi:transcriptional regulator with XRE-family HTH domain